MSDPAEIILHNYPQSPVAEKVRVVLGIKGLAWRDVEIPRLPPKPNLVVLTGGYRRTPVMQIGAEIFCDSQCIIAELERRHPEPSLMPTADAGLLWCLSRWTDGGLFDLGVKIVLGSAGENLPADFAADRGRLYLGEDWANGLKAANAQLPHLVAQMRGQLAWLEQVLADGRNFLVGASPAAIDAQFYHVVWFLRERWDGGPVLVGEFPALQRWADRVKAMGHGNAVSMSAEEAIERARQVEPDARQGVADHDPQGLSVGQNVTIGPDVDGGEQPVSGKVRFADAHTVIVDRDDPQIGRVSVYFPRVGYRIETT